MQQQNAQHRNGGHRPPSPAGRETPAIASTLPARASGCRPRARDGPRGQSGTVGTAVPDLHPAGVPPRIRPGFPCCGPMRGGRGIRSCRSAARAGDSPVAESSRGAATQAKSILEVRTSGEAPRAACRRYGDPEAWQILLFRVAKRSGADPGVEGQTLMQAVGVAELAVPDPGAGAENPEVRLKGSARPAPGPDAPGVIEVGPTLGGEQHPVEQRPAAPGRAEFPDRDGEHGHRRPVVPVLRRQELDGAARSSRTTLRRRRGSLQIGSRIVFVPRTGCSAMASHRSGVVPSRPTIRHRRPRSTSTNSPVPAARTFSNFSRMSPSRSPTVTTRVSGQAAASWQARSSPGRPRAPSGPVAPSGPRHCHIGGRGWRSRRAGARLRRPQA